MSLNLYLGVGPSPGGGGGATNITGTLTSGKVPVASGAQALSDSNVAVASGGWTLTGSADVAQLTIKANATQTAPVLSLENSDETKLARWYPLSGDNTFVAAYFGNIATPGALNYSLKGDGSDLFLNATNTIDIRLNNGIGGRLLFDGNLRMISDTNQYKFGAASDTGLVRSSASVFTATDGSTGIGDYQAAGSLLTAGTLTETNKALARKVIHRYDWTNAMVVALGASLTGDITAFTLPAKTVVTNAYIVITGTAAGVSTLSVALGRTGASYIDYIVASDAKATANTVYGDASGERGTNLTGYDLPSFTGTTAVKLHFISTVENLDQTTGSAGAVYIETMTMP